MLIHDNGRDAARQGCATSVIIFLISDEKYKGIRSTELLKQVKEIIEKEGYTVGNVDSIIVAEYPRVAPYIEKIKASLAQCLGVSESQVAIKATTEEGLGFTGAKEGVSAHAVAVLKEKA